jgi:hypothetical protein
MAIGKCTQGALWIAALIVTHADIVSAQDTRSQTRAADRNAAPSCLPRTPVDVVTHRNNNSRTGANLEETCLTPTNVNAASFGKLFTLSVTGQVYAQPLVVTNLEIRGSAHNVVYVATMENWVYAFDADGLHRDGDGIPRPYWSRSLGPPLPVDRIPKDIGASLGKYNIEPFVGITSTPVIDRSTNSIILVAKIAKVIESEVDCDKKAATRKCPVVNQIFSLDLRDGSVRDAKEIRLPEPEPAQQGRGCGLLDPRRTTKWDAGRINLQRPALLYTKGSAAGSGHIYLGFGSHQDAPCPMYHGMVIGFDYDGVKLTQFPDDHRFLASRLGETDSAGIKHPTKLGKAGIWQAGNGPAADDEGNVYVMTGNGGFEPDRQFGSNFVKLNPMLTPTSWFAPANVDLLNSDTLDIDLGSAGPVLLPGSDEIVGGGKQGKLYLLDRSSLGGRQKGGWPHDHTDPPLQDFWAAHRWSVSLLYGWFPISLILPASATGFHHIHGSPAFWGSSPTNLQHGVLYVWPERDHLKAFSYTRTPGQHGAFATKPIARGPEAGRGMPGGMLSISADGSNPGILWASLPLHDDAWIDIVRGALRAFKITSDGKTLDPIWSSYCADKDDRFNFGKYVPPTVANGKVYLATFSGFVSVYGLRPRGRLGREAPPDCSVSEFMLEPSYKKTHQVSQQGR